MVRFICLTHWLLVLMILINEELVEGRKIVNRAIVKTIEVDDGEIIDCYDIYKQPSLNHPLLSNHTIQMTPSSYPRQMKSDNLGTLQLTQTWHKYGSCPERTIPIRRKGKSYDLASLRKHYDVTDGHEYAYVRVNGNFLGAQAKINLWKPVTEILEEISVSQIWIAAGENNNKNTIEAGWEVDVDLYGDAHTRFFIFWTTDGYQDTGCYNLMCEGFVHTSSDIALGCAFSEVSTFNGSLKDASFNIHKDQNTGNWWVQLQGIAVGYYPSSLFTELSKMATRVSWGGEITNLESRGQHTSTQMGSGHFPSEGGLKTSSYFNWIQVVDENNMTKDPENVEIIVTKPACYDLKIDNNHHDTNGFAFYYGGPGYSDKCQ
ncbi:hypothetical protein MKX03_029867 [Papaver bracteatum]|nr:hypothetical protein MKX03_029867 [Papaver bracteatum]